MNTSYALSLPRSSNRKIRVMLVEDHPLMLQGLRRVLESSRKIDVVAEVRNGVEAVKQAAIIKPDVIVMDINLPTKNGLQATREITKPSDNKTGVIILTAYDDAEQIFHALCAGALAYYPKNVEPRALIRAVYDVADGKYVIRGKATNRTNARLWMKEQLAKRLDLDDYSTPSFILLSPRQMQILSMIIQGSSKKEVASSLGISLETVRTHIRSTLRKLGVRDCTQASVLLLHRGWVRFEDSTM